MIYEAYRLKYDFRFRKHKASEDQAGWDFNEHIDWKMTDYEYERADKKVFIR